MVSPLLANQDLTPMLLRTDGKTKRSIRYKSRKFGGDYFHQPLMAFDVE